MLTILCVQNKLLISIWTLFLSSSSLPPFFSISLSVSKFILVLLFSDLIDCYEKWLSIRLRAIPLPGPFIETASTFTVLLTHKPPPVTKTNTCAHTHVYVCAHTILTQVGGTNGHKLSKPTHRDTHAPTTLAHALLLFYLLSINQISAYFGNAAPSRGRSVLGAHCREPHCQPTAPTLMTSSLCTIHQSRTCPTVIPFSCSY